jgi:hypothetical protein
MMNDSAIYEKQTANGNKGTTMMTTVRKQLEETHGNT